MVKYAQQFEAFMYREIRKTDLGVNLQDINSVILTIVLINLKLQNKLHLFFLLKLLSTLMESKMFYPHTSAGT